MRRRQFFGSLSGAMAWPFAARAQQPSTSGAAVKGADIFLQKSRNASIDSHAIVQNGDDLGRIVFQGSNGTTFDTGAIIMAEVDGKPGASADMPTRLVFLTAPEGSATPIRRMRINANGQVEIRQPDNVIALDINSGEHTQATPIIDVEANWNNGSEKHTAIKADISDIASGSTSQLLTLQINGSDRFAVQKDGTVLIGGHVRRGSPVTKTNDFTVADTENWLICNKGSSLTVTLPSAASYIGREITIKTIQAQTVVSAASNVIPLAGGAAGTAILAGTAGKWGTLVSNGTNWEIMQGN
jgi:hypothetical protein